MLGDDFQSRVSLRDRSGMALEEFEAAVEKLLVHGGARRDIEGNLSRGGRVGANPTSGNASTS